jgi:hypothetical protein
LSQDAEKANKQKESIRKENTRIETAFGNNTVLPMHPMGFRTGVKSETL